MSSTSNAQDLLVNVFRPTYTWDSNTGFVPSLVVSNVTEVIASRIQTSALVVSDSNNNTYIGDSAGLYASNTFSNVGIGFSAMGGALNSDCNVAIGTYALDGLADSDSNVAIGARTDITGTGVRNILLGTNVTLAGGGSNNILIGVDLSRTAISNTLQIGSLLYGNLANGYIGINTPTPMSALDISGEVVFRNKVGIQTEYPVYSLDVRGSAYVSNQLLTEYGTRTVPAYSFVSNQTTGLYRPTDASYGTGAIGISVNGMDRLVVTSNKTFIYGNLDVCGTLSAAAGGGGGGGGGGTVASNGTAAAPSFTFSNDLSTGLHLVQTSTLAFDTSGVQRMCISGGFVGIGTATPRVALDVSGDISANVYNGPGGTQAAPHYTFSDDRTTGFFFPGANIVGFTAGGVERMRISNSNIGIGTRAPSNALDVSGTLRVIGTTGGDITFTNGAIAIAGNTVVSSTGVLSNGAATSNSIGGVTLSNTNVSGVTTLTATNGLVSGYLRNTLIPTQFDISGGNISNSGTHTASNFIGTSSASNSIGDVTLSNTNITYAGAISNTTAASSNTIGGVTLSNSRLVTSYGTVAAPAVCLADASTGFYRPNVAAGIYASLAGVRALGITSNLFEFSNRGVQTLWLTDNQLQASAGSVGTPSYAYAGDASLGFYRIGSGQLGFTTAGENRMTLSNANLGIGKAPAFALDVSGSANIQAGNGSGALYVGGSSTGVVIQRDVGGNGYIRPLGSGVNLYLGTSNDNTVTILSTGLVGIGNLTPGYTLDVNGTTSTTNAIVSGYLRNALAPTQFDISGGNISNSGTHTSSNFISSLDSASNRLGGVTLRNGGVRYTLPVNPLVVATGQGANTLAYSVDEGSNWIPGGSSVFSTIGYCATWNGSLWVAGGNGAAHTLAFSPNGIAWTGNGKITFTNAVRGIAWSGTRWVAVGNGLNSIGYSSDGISWTGIGSTIFTTGGNQIAWNGSIFVAVGDGNSAVATSPDGINWTQRVASASSYGTGVAWSGSLWVVTGVGLAGPVITSPDGITWTARTVTGMTNGWAVAWNGSLWMAVGQTVSSGKIQTSPDGITWTAQTDALASPLYGVAWTGSLWVVTGTPSGGNCIETSADGVSWTPRGGTTFTTAAFGVSSGRYILPVIADNILDASGGNIGLAGKLTSLNTAAVHQLGGATFSNRFVGIGTASPAFSLDICGTVRALEGLKQGTNTWGAYSDRRIKQDIHMADTSLCYSIVKSLPLQRFTWDASYLPTIKDRKSVGWIAQDVEQVFPRAVVTSEDFGLNDLRVLDVDQIYKTMYGALEKVIADKEATEAKLARVLRRLATIEAALDISESLVEPPVDVSGVVMDISGVVLDVSGVVVDVSGTVLDVSGVVMDVSGEVMDVSGEVLDVSGTVLDVSGEVMDVSGASQQSSESTQPTPQTPPQPEEPPAASPEPQPQPSSEYAPAPAETEA